MAWHLDTRTLRMLIAVAEAPTAAQAAARLAVSPSALSHQMRKAEATLRVALFDRRGRGIHLTAVGEQLCASARAIVGALEEAEGILERSRRGDRPTIRLGGGAYPVQRLLTGCLAAGRLSLRDLAQVDVVSRTRAFPPAQAVAEGELDLALVCARVTHRSLAALPAFGDDLVAVVPADHPLARARWLDRRGFAAETYVSYSRIREEGLEDDLLFRPTGGAPARFLLAETVEAILDLVEAGLGFSVLSRWSVPGDRPGLAAIPLGEGGARVEWSVAHRRAERDGEVLALARRIAEALAGGLAGGLADPPG